MGAQIMIVEDDYITAADIKSQLVAWGYSVCCITDNGEEAGRCAEHYHPDLILMNINLWGGIDGLEAATRIKQRFDTPIIFISGYKQESLVDKAMSFYPFWYLGKPVDDQKLMTTIELALASYGVRESNI